MSRSTKTRHGAAGFAGAFVLVMSGLTSCAALAQAVGADKSNPSSPTSTSEERLRRLLQAAPAAAAVSPEARAKLLRDGEAALSRGEIEQAATAFEQAGFVKHAADAELGLIRTYMQSGQYRRALVFAAHTAGAHPEVGAGAGLYAWLLHLGGQSQIAARMLQRAQERLPDDPVLGAAQRLLTGASPSAFPALLQTPARFAPYPDASINLPATARTVASGVLIDDGHAVVTAGIAGGDVVKWWVRDGLGRVRAAALDHTRIAPDTVVLKLSSPLAAPAPVAAARDPFPGSPVMAIEFSDSASSPQSDRLGTAAKHAAADPAWPILRIGFLGTALPGDGRFRLGVSMPSGPRGGPVFDAAGRLIGIAIASEQGDALLAASSLRGSVANLPADARSAAPRLALDELYERALSQTVQVLRAD